MKTAIELAKQIVAAFDEGWRTEKDHTFNDDHLILARALLTLTSDAAGSDGK